MVDTPGHADFGMEVSKSLDSVEGAVLLFDAAQGVQAQTLSVYDKARTIGRQRNEWKRGLVEKVGTNPDKADGEEMGFRVLPVLTKIDIPSARPLEVALAVSDLFGFDPDSILKTSARARIGIKEVLDVICDKVPPPDSLADDDGTILRAKVIDSWFEPRRGVVCLVRVLSGSNRRRRPHFHHRRRPSQKRQLLRTRNRTRSSPSHEDESFISWSNGLCHRRVA